jgi:transcriptional regulator with XRE-family HTH domain
VNLKHLGQVIRDRRESCGISLQQLADAMNVHVSFADGLERGEDEELLEMLSVHELAALAAALGCKPFQLLLLVEMESAKSSALASSEGVIA